MRVIPSGVYLSTRGVFQSDLTFGKQYLLKLKQVKYIQFQLNRLHNTKDAYLQTVYSFMSSDSSIVQRLIPAFIPILKTDFSFKCSKHHCLWVGADYTNLSRINSLNFVLRN
ncbi:Hypothetical_protein [Hexamita inflata]|uniref:Hypothetical_protein n=1 Tax=Hexamita inflata TaxID=28002 RepID=A0AA86NQZ5_9EUKA|nr:Hypothetical protein HINF_LOCUS11599 [Hexamita inflata]CAI9953214.1 Hypothetical protein HINF_LOCUS40859 [Hexamita inflata]